MKVLQIYSFHSPKLKIIINRSMKIKFIDTSSLLRQTGLFVYILVTSTQYTAQLYFAKSFVNINAYSRHQNYTCYTNLYLTESSSISKYIPQISRCQVYITYAHDGCHSYLAHSIFGQSVFETSCLIYSLIALNT